MSPGGRVLRVVTRLNRGGPLRQIHALAPALRAHGWTGVVLAGRTDDREPDGTADLRRAGVEVIRLRSLSRSPEPGADARALREILGHVRRVRPDLVHTHMAKAGALGRVAARLAGVPAVHTFHGHHLQAPFPRDRLARAAERFLGQWTAAAVCLTPRQRRDLVEIHRVVPADRAHLIGPGLDVPYFRSRAASPAGLRDRFGGPDLPLFVWAGRFVAVKDPLLLVRAAARSARGFRLVMLGDGPLREEVRRQVQAEGLGGHVFVPGAVESVAPWIAACDAVVLCSRREGAPLFLLEAKVLGRPAIVTTVGGVPDLVRHGVDGWWVPPGSAHDLALALDLLAGDAPLRERMGRAAGTEVEEHFGAPRLARETAALYDLVRDRRRSAPKAVPRGGPVPSGG